MSTKAPTPGTVLTVFLKASSHSAHSKPLKRLEIREQSSTTGLKPRCQLEYAANDPDEERSACLPAKLSAPAGFSVAKRPGPWHLDTLDQRSRVSSIASIATKVYFSSAARTFLMTPPGVGYQRRLPSKTFDPSMSTLSSPRPPFAVSTLRSGSCKRSAATRVAIKFFMGQTGQ